MSRFLRDTWLNDDRLRFGVVYRLMSKRNNFVDFSLSFYYHWTVVARKHNEFKFFKNIFRFLSLIGSHNKRNEHSLEHTLQSTTECDNRSTTMWTVNTGTSLRRQQKQHQSSCLVSFFLDAKWKHERPKVRQRQTTTEIESTTTWTTVRNEQPYESPTETIPLEKYMNSRYNAVVNQQMTIDDEWRWCRINALRGDENKMDFDICTNGFRIGLM